MFAYLWRILTDESTFTQVVANAAGNSKVRGALLGIAVAMATGQIPLGPLAKYQGLFAALFAAGGGLIAHGDANAPLVDRITKLEARLP